MKTLQVCQDIIYAYVYTDKQCLKVTKNAGEAKFEKATEETQRQQHVLPTLRHKNC